MSKPVVVSLNGQQSQFGLRAVKRSALYGRRRRVALDKDGNPCTRASLLADGSLLLQSGMTGQGYFTDDGSMYKLGDLTALSPEGEELPVAPSTLGVCQELTGPIDPTFLLDLRVQAVYLLDPTEVDDDLLQRLQAGELFSFGFNFRDDYHEETAVLLASSEGVFALVGDPIARSWAALETAATLPTEDAEADDDDLDFEMF
ncbi:MAG: hypothetical protein KDC39_11890 [Actinobacteria bacterium]|nr:hypothetical protein [Actinomycetota bacterium]